MQKKLIAIDLDGTTLNKASQLDQTTIQTLQTLEQLGHMVAVVTGRPYRSSRDLYAQLAIKGPLVNFNGALCHLPGQDDWEGSYHVTLDPDLVLDIIKQKEKLAADYLLVEGKDLVYSTIAQLPPSPFFDRDLVPILLQGQTSLDEATTAVTIFSPIEEQTSIKQDLLKRYGGAIDVRTWGGPLPCLEVVTTGVHKAKAVHHLAQYYGFQQRDILAFGDEDNDMEMIQYAGHGVAMQNAIPELKALAQDITRYSHDQLGLANYLQDYFGLAKIS